MSRPSLSVAFVLLPDFTLTPFAGLVDVLRLAADDGDGSRPRRFRWQVVGDAPVRSSAGTVVTPDRRLADADRFDYLVVCGGLLRAEREADPALVAFIRRHAAHATVVGLCTASFTLAAAGLLDGRRACVSWFHHAEFREAFPAIAVSASELFVIDGPVVTCAGGSAAIDVGAWIVERHLGAATARKALDILVAAETRAPDTPQPHRVSSTLADARLKKAALLVEQRLGDPPSVARLAAAVGLSRRQLERLFVAETGRSPRQYLVDARLAQARWLMATTTRTLTDIAGETGFGDASQFSRAYLRARGVTPSRDRPALRRPAGDAPAA